MILNVLISFISVCILTSDNLVYMRLFGIIKKKRKEKQIGGSIMNIKQKLGYMLIGCLFTIAGYIIASLGGGATHAQDVKTAVFDQIVCSELLVVRKPGKPAASIVAAENGGFIEVYNKEERTTTFIGVREHGADIEVYHKAGRPIASIRASEHGGDIKVYNKEEKTVASIVTDEDGNGVIQTYKEGWRPTERTNDE